MTNRIVYQSVQILKTTQPVVHDCENPDIAHRTQGVSKAMFWIFMLITGIAYVLLKLGALKVWILVFKMALWIVTIVAILLGIVVVWKWVSSRRGF